MIHFRSLLLVALVAVAAVIGASRIPQGLAAPVPDTVRSLYDPLTVRDFSLVLEPLAGWQPAEGWLPPEGWDTWTDEEKAAYLEHLAREAAWDVIRFDTTNSIILPARFSVPGEEPLLVGVRRKSSRALPSEADPQKVGLKVGFGDFVAGQRWNGVSKLSLENGGDVSPVAEGLAWNLHQMAEGEGFYAAGQDPALAAWVTLSVNGRPTGVYTSVEQRNKQFLRNRGFWVSGSTWLYEQDDIGKPEIDEGPASLPDGTVPDSSTHQTLCYAPFLPASTACPAPSDAVLGTQLPALIDMRAMLTQAAVDAFTGNNDALVSKGKNFHFVDREGERRLYYPWDLDAVFGGSPSSVNIYALSSATVKRKTTYTQSDYQRIILNHPLFRTQYNQIMLGLLDGPLATAKVNAYLTQLEAVLGPALAADPYAAAVIGPSVPDHFRDLRTWVEQRATAVRQQVALNEPAPRAPYPGIPDAVPPSVGAVTLSPAKAITSSAVTVTANASDSIGVVSAEVRVGDGEWLPLAPADGAFGGTNEGVTGTFTAPDTAGTYQVCLRAADAAGNVSATSCALLTAEAPRAVTLLAYSGTLTARAGANLTLSATLTSLGSGVEGKTVTLVFNKVTYTALTNASGVASVSVKAPAKTGSYPVSASFAGDVALLPSAVNVTMVVGR